MKTIDELLMDSKPMTLKEKLEDLWFDISYYYPGRIRDGWWALCRFCRNLRKFWKILWTDNDFDHGYLEKLLITKLTLMAKYFRTSRIVVGEEEIYNQINLALRVGKIAFEMDEEEDNYGGRYGFEYIGYVNTKNYRRFWPSLPEKYLTKEGTDLYLTNLTELRRLKARQLFYQILSRYSQRWWD